MLLSPTSTKPNSIRPLRHLLIARQNLVGPGRPGNREQRENRNDGQRFHGLIVVFECGRKCQSSAHFQDNPGKHHGHRVPRGWFPAARRVSRSGTGERSGE